VWAQQHGLEEPFNMLQQQQIVKARLLCCAMLCSLPPQNVSVPLSWEKAGGVAAVKRYVAQLQDVGAQVGGFNNSPIP
jgi:hypothetical protein